MSGHSTDRSSVGTVRSIGSRKTYTAQDVREAKKKLSDERFKENQDERRSKDSRLDARNLIKVRSQRDSFQDQQFQNRQNSIKKLSSRQTSRQTTPMASPREPNMKVRVATPREVAIRAMSPSTDKSWLPEDPWDPVPDGPSALNIPRAATEEINDFEERNHERTLFKQKKVMDRRFNDARLGIKRHSYASRAGHSFDSDSD